MKKIEASLMDQLKYYPQFLQLREMKEGVLTLNFLKKTGVAFLKFYKKIKKC